MRAALAAVLALAPAACLAEEAPAWAFAATGYWNTVKGADDYGSAILSADRGPFHLEGRFNYEARHAQSGFVGWTFSGGKEVAWMVRPIAGGVAGDARGPILGLEASLTAGRFDAYVEFEHVRDREGGHYNYAWSEAAFKPAEWLRLGLVAQRTRIYGEDHRELQRGGLVQVIHKSLTVGAYWFNPGSDDQVVMVSAGVTF